MESTILAYYRLCACLPNPHYMTSAALFGAEKKEYMIGDMVQATFVGGEAPHIMVFSV